MEIYEWADNAINTSPRYATGFTELLSPTPYVMRSTVRGAYDARLALIRAYQATALGIFRAALRNELDPAILHWLMNETPASLGLDFHRRLEERHFTLPVFFRTDEARPGRILEIQCPGSHWGELQLIFEHAARMGYAAGEASPADQFVAQLTDFLHEAPIVHHFLDKSSAPAGMRYFVEKTRPGVKYWSFDQGIRPEMCNFIRTHAFVEVWADDRCAARLAKVGEGLAYDFPPYILFDQKAALVLPFWSRTRTSFSDEIRGLFPFTTPLLPAGIELPDGTCVTLETFSSWPRSLRSYYLKYAGADWSLNWGSKAVYRLSSLNSTQCLDLLRQSLSGFERGHVWLLQKEETENNMITYLARDGTLQTHSLRAKFSGFYGPGGCLGVLAYHRQHNKVHGQEDTVLSYVLAAGEDGRRA